MLKRGSVDSINLPVLYSSTKKEKRRRSMSKSMKSFPKYRGEGTSILSYSRSVPANPIQLLFKSRCIDLNITPLMDQELRFVHCCEKSISNRRIDFTSLGLGPSSAEALEFLLKSSVFSHLVLKGNSLGSRGLLNLSSSISKNSSIVHLDISNNRLSSENLDKFFKTVKNHLSITSLHIGSDERMNKNKIGARGAMFLPELLKSSILTMLNLSGNKIGSEGLGFLTLGLKHNKTLLTLNLAGNEISSKNVKKFSAVLANTSILDLDMSDNKIADEGLVSITEYMGLLLKLNVAKNGISREGSEKLFSYLSNNIKLFSLNMDENNLEKQAGVSIGSCLFKNSALKYLSLNSCNLKTQGVVHLSNGIINNRGLINLNINKNNIKNIDSLMHSLKGNKTLESLDISSNLISNGRAILIFLEFNTKVKVLNLRNNVLEDEFAVELKRILKINQFVRKILLEENPISTKHRVETNECLKKNRKCEVPTVNQDCLHFDIVKVNHLIEKKKTENFYFKKKLDRKQQDLKDHQEIEDKKFEEISKIYKELEHYHKQIDRDLANIRGNIQKCIADHEYHIYNHEESQNKLVEKCQKLEKIKFEMLEKIRKRKYGLNSEIKSLRNELIGLREHESECRCQLNNLLSVKNSLNEKIQGLKRPKFKKISKKKTGK